jgi:membrane protein involved in colicin uptake
VSYERTNETVDGKEVWLRHVKKIVALYDVANVSHPAYEQTSVGTREQSDRINEAIDAQLKRECGDDDEAKKKAEEEAKAEEERKAKEEQEARELAEREQKEREAVAVMRMRRNRLALQNRDIETFIF